MKRPLAILIPAYNERQVIARCRDEKLLYAADRVKADYSFVGRVSRAHLANGVKS